MARKLGAHETIDYVSDDLGERILELTAGRGAHVILDTVGASMWESYWRGIVRSGRIVTCGFTGGDEVGINLRQILGNRLSILGSGPQGAKNQVRR